MQGVIMNKQVTAVATGLDPNGTLGGMWNLPQDDPTFPPPHPPVRLGYSPTSIPH